MKPGERLIWLQKEVDNLVNRYQNESRRYKRVAFRLKIISVFLAATITVLLGIKLQYTTVANVLSNIALFLSAAITVLSAYEAFFDPRALWFRETITFARLKDLQRDLLYFTAGADPNSIKMEELDKFKERLDMILEDTLKYWMKIKGAQDMAKALKGRADLKSGNDTLKT